MTVRGHFQVYLWCLVMSLIITTSLQQNECVTNMDIIFVVDGSNSMGRTNFNTQIQTIKNLVAEMPVNDAEVHVGIEIYSSLVDTDIALTGNSLDILNANIPYPDDGTRTDRGIEAARTNFANNARNGNVPKVMMVITDGLSDIPELTQQQGDLAKAEGIDIYAVGVTESVDMTELQGLASSLNQAYISPNFDTLEDTLSTVTNQACVSIDCGDTIMDLAFILDASVDEDTFNAFKGFITTFIAFADIDGGLVRAAVVTYSDTASVRINLNDYLTGDGFLTAVKTLTPSGAGSNPSAALGLLESTVYTTTNGDRNDAPNVAILLTGSMATIHSGHLADQALYIRSTGVQIYTVGVDLPSTTEIEEISSLPVEEYSTSVSGTDELTDVVVTIFDDLNSKFCKVPVIPACYMGFRDIWLVADVSSTASQLSSKVTFGDFGYLKEGLHGLVDIVLDPSVPNDYIHLGLIAYSDSVAKLVDVQQFNSSMLVSDAIDILPAGVPQGSTRVDLALQQITEPAVVSTQDSYVIIVTAEPVPDSLSGALTSQIIRLKNAGFTVVLVTVFPIAGQAGPTYSLASYQDLLPAMNNFTRDYLCVDEVPSVPTTTPEPVIDNGDYTSLCLLYGSKTDGETIAHPFACDKYIQCYYNHDEPLDLAVTRHCPAGLFYSNSVKKCTAPANANCLYDKCAVDCEPYSMTGNCRSYWSCVDGASVAMCCEESYAFVPGKGCTPDPTCTDPCAPATECLEDGYGFCSKRPVWDVPAAYELSYNNLVTWSVGRPCIGVNFDIVTCDCTATIYPVCTPDHTYDFTNPDTLQSYAAGSGNCLEMTINDVTYTTKGAVLGKGSSLHIPMDAMYSPDSAFTISMRYAESDTSPYGTIIMKGSQNCAAGGSSFMVITGEGFIDFGLRVTSDSSLSVIQVPTEGISRQEFKDLTLTFVDGTLSLSIKGDNQQYIQRTEVSEGISIRCGFDIGGDLNFDFEGIIESLSVSSCVPGKLY